MYTNPALCSKSVKTQQTGLSPPPPTSTHYTDKIYGLAERT